MNKQIDLPPAYVPPLENGDRLSREEFERRFEAMPHLKKAELIEGVVHMPSPVRVGQHAGPHGDLITFLGIYRYSTPGVGIGDNATVRLDLDNEPQPDGVLFIEPSCHGQARIDEEDYIEGAPELAAEVSSSTVSIGLGPKLQVYRRNGVREYLVWRVLDSAFDWFVLRKSQFERLEPKGGIHKSEVFPGLWLDAAALIEGNLPRVQEVLQQGLASAGHHDFVAKLQKKN
jgi:Uma2 family endonuclease